MRTMAYCLIVSIVTLFATSLVGLSSIGGNHLLVELAQCDGTLLKQVPFVEETLRKAALATGATIVASAFYQFSPEGVSGVLVLAESHISIHTWPEKSFCSIDIYTCGNMNNYAALAVLQEAFKSQYCETQSISRGIKHVPVAADDNLVLAEPTA